MQLLRVATRVDGGGGQRFFGHNNALSREQTRPPESADLHPSEAVKRRLGKEVSLPRRKAAESGQKSHGEAAKLLDPGFTAMHSEISMNAETFYDRDYWADGKHSSLEWTEPMFRTWMAPLLSRDAVLDYGCGLGYGYQRRLMAAAKRYVGADVSGMAVADARRKGLEAVPVDAANGSVPCSDAAFDGAVCVEVFEHLFDPLSAARELNRVLKPGGVLVATVPNFGYHAWRFLAFLRAQVPLEPERPSENRFKGVHIRFFSKRLFKQLLHNAGFVDIQIGSFGTSSVWDVFHAMGHAARITTFAHKYIPSLLHLRFLEDVWPNVFASRLRAVAWKPR